MDKDLIGQLSDILRQIIKEEILLFNNRTVQDSPFSQAITSKLAVHTVPSSKIGWIKEEQKLQLFYNLLINHGFISCSYKIFRSHFIGIEVCEKIKWLSHKTYLAYLFNALRLGGFIPKSKSPHKLLTEHFVDGDGSPLSSNNLRSSLNIVQNNKSVESLENIIIAIEDEE